jgi:hypothetical protein
MLLSYVGQVFNLRPIFNRPGRLRANAAQAGYKPAAG